jgi:hypothetical protein
MKFVLIPSAKTCVYNAICNFYFCCIGLKSRFFCIETVFSSLQTVCTIICCLHQWAVKIVTRTQFKVPMLRDFRLQAFHQTIQHGPLAPFQVWMHVWVEIFFPFWARDAIHTISSKKISCPCYNTLCLGMFFSNDLFIKGIQTLSNFRTSWISCTFRIVYGQMGQWVNYVKNPTDPSIL